MIYWGLLAPMFFMGALILLSRLEEWVVAPIDRAARINRLLAETSPEELERAVAEYLAPVVPHRSLRTVEQTVEDDTQPLAIPKLPVASGS